MARVFTTGRRARFLNSAARGCLKTVALCLAVPAWVDATVECNVGTLAGTTECGVDLNTIRELLGHSDYTMTLRYANLAPKFKMKAVEVLDMAREAAMSENNVVALVR
jgi:hypothetical protein